MKYILTTLEGGIHGPFNSAEKTDDGYLCDNESYQTTVTGEVVKSEVADDYINPTHNTEPQFEASQVQLEQVVTEGATS